MNDREAFEAWFKPTFYDDCAWSESRNCYVEPSVHMAWKGWQAAIQHARDVAAEIVLRDPAGAAMTHPTDDSLKPCPFCGAGTTEITPNGRMWTGMKYSEPSSVSVRHWCEAVPGQPSRMIERVGRDEASAIAAWNTRALLAEPETNRDWSQAQDWKGMDGTTAFHLIQRHANGWGDVGAMMNAWLAANAATRRAIVRAAAEIGKINEAKHHPV